MKKLIAYINETIELSKNEQKVFNACKHKLNSLINAEDKILDNIDSLNIEAIIDNLDGQDYEGINSIILNKILNNQTSLRKLKTKCIEYCKNKNK